MKIAEVSALLISLFTVVSVALALTAWVTYAWKKQEESVSLRPWPNDARRLLLWAAVLAVGSRLLLLGYVVLLSHLQGIDVGLDNLWSRGDAHHYLWIAQNGYTSDRALGDGWLYIVFYPLYPLLTGLMGKVLGQYTLSGIVVSLLCFAGSAAAMYRWVGVGLGEEHARRSVAYLLLFPMGLFFGMPYSESLFMMLSVLCFMSLESRQWMLAGLWGFLAALTRNMGVLLVVPFFVEVLQANKLLRFHRPARPDLVKALRQGTWMLLIPLGMALYLLINYWVYGDPFMFLQIQKDHWDQQMTWFFKSPATTVQMLLTKRNSSSLSIWWPQTIVMVLMLAALPALVRKGRIAWGAYLIVYTVVALSPTWLLSFPRYVMGIAPLYPMLSLLCRPKWANRVLCILMALGLLYICSVYSTGILMV